jgi:hypothetical protein
MFRQLEPGTKKERKHTHINTRPIYSILITKPQESASSHDSFHTTTNYHHHHQADVHNLTSISYSFLQKLKSSETLEHLAEHQLEIANTHT